MGEGRPPDPDAGPAPDASDDPGTLSFEAALRQLEAVVESLERGDLELEAALVAFERGVALTRRCAGQLEEAERRIETLVREGERWVARPLDGENE